MPRVTRMARWLTVCQDPSLFCVNPTTHQKNMLMMMMTINLIYTQLKYQYNNRNKYINSLYTVLQICHLGILHDQQNRE